MLKQPGSLNQRISTANSWQDIPADVLGLIAVNLSDVDTNRYMRVCKRFHNVFKADELIWRLKVGRDFGEDEIKDGQKKGWLAIYKELYLGPMRKEVASLKLEYVMVIGENEVYLGRTPKARLISGEYAKIIEEMQSSKHTSLRIMGRDFIVLKTEINCCIQLKWGSKTTSIWKANNAIVIGIADSPVVPEQLSVQIATFANRVEDRMKVKK